MADFFGGQGVADVVQGFVGVLVARFQLPAVEGGIAVGDIVKIAAIVGKLPVPPAHAGNGRGLVADQGARFLRGVQVVEEPQSRR